MNEARGALVVRSCDESDISRLAVGPSFDDDSIRAQWSSP